MAVRQQCREKRHTRLVRKAKTRSLYATNETAVHARAAAQQTMLTHCIMSSLSNGRAALSTHQGFPARALHQFGLPAQQASAFHNLLEGPRPAPGNGLERGSGRQSRWGDLQLLGDARAFAAQRVDLLLAVGAGSVAAVECSKFRPLRLGHSGRPRDRLLERAQPRPNDDSRQFGSLVQGRAGVGLRPLEQVQYLLIAKDLEGRQVGAPGVRVAPAPDLSQIGQLAAGQPPGSLDAPSFLGVARIITSGRLHHRPATFPVPIDPPPLAKLATHALGERLEKTRVVDRVAQLLFAKRPERPVRFLPFFSNRDIEESL